MQPLSSSQWQHATQISQEPQKHGHKTLIWSLLAVLLLGGGGVGGYYFHNIQSKEREREAETTIQPVQAQPSAIQETTPQPPPISAPPQQQRSAEPQPSQPATQMVPGMYPNASLRLLADADLSGKSKFDLKIMRNEIFARRGYIFRTPDMQRYFSSQSWYVPRFADVTGMLTQIEKANVEFIKKYERISPR